MAARPRPRSFFATGSAGVGSAGFTEIPLDWREKAVYHGLDAQEFICYYFSTYGLETSPYMDALAGLRANEARYFKNKYNHGFATEKAESAGPAVQYVERILHEERRIVLAAKPLEATSFQVEYIQFTYVFYESGLAVNVMYTIDDPKKRAVGFKLAEGMPIPDEPQGR